MTEPTPSGSVTDALQVHVARIIGTAEQAAIELQREVELEAARRAAAVHAQAQDDADRIRAEAEAQAAAYLEETRVRIDAFATARVTRISELTDTLLAKGEAIQSHMDGAAELQGQLRELLAALAAAARAAAAESTRPGLVLPPVAAAPAGDAPHSEPEPAPALATAGLPDVSEDAGANVQRIAQDLPRAPRPTSPSEDRSA